jgi:glyoxylase-like metal-dependent hydrolase (beta-lactamase superfamily II)
VPSLPVDIVLQDGMELDGLRLIHVPGHCPGQVCIAVGDMLLTADHVLADITPHQSPESIVPYTGLGHYLDSLAKIRAAGEYRLGLGGHGPPIQELAARITDIELSHERKLAKILELMREAGQPLTIHEISKRLYSRVEGFHVLLALEEVGAHIEYLYERGALAITNLDEFEQKQSVAIRYVPA